MGRPGVSARGENDDDQVVAGLRRGETAAFDIAYERYRARVFGFLFRMSRNRTVAEDLLQETWVRLAKSATRLSPETNLKAWLFTVARNLYRRHSRWSALNAERIEEFGSIESLSVPRTPVESASAREAALAVERAISGLAPKYREVILLVGVRGAKSTRGLARSRSNPSSNSEAPESGARYPSRGD